jgi:hypothetical protein
LSPGARRAARLAAAALIPIALCLAALLTARAVVLAGLRRFDPGAEMESVSFSFGAILLEGVVLPGRGFEAPLVWACYDGAIPGARPDVIIVPSCTFTDPGRSPHGGAGGSPRALAEIRIDEALLVTGPDTSKASAWIAEGGSGFCGLALGSWGSLRISGSIHSGRVEMNAVFRECTRIPGGFFSYPSSLEGHSFSGTMAGSFASDTVSFDGTLDSLDGVPAGIPFALSGSLGGTLDLEATTDLSPVEPILSRWLSGFDREAFLRLDPEGSARLRFVEGRPCTYAVEARLDSALVYSGLLASDTVEFSASASLEGRFDSDGFTIDSGRVSLGEIELELTLEAGGGRVALHAWNPAIAGGAIASSIPGALQGRLRGTSLSGELGVDMLLVVDSQTPESSDVRLSIDASRLSVDWCPVSVTRLRTGGSCEMSDSWGNSRTIDLDPSTNHAFVPLDSMPPVFEDILCCAEDGEFRWHSGFSPGHIRSSLIEDVSSRRFVRGASTITMQLARNLFLSRERTLSRKLQEIFLTWRLEECLSKDRIIEIYANIVELGPDVFGFPEAAGYYFGRRLQDLSPRQIAYLVSLLPGPRPYSRFFADGVVPRWWEEYLDVLIRGAANRGGLTPAEAAAALLERIEFRGTPGPQALRYSRGTPCSVIVIL